MILDAHKAKTILNRVADIAIVGSGPAGITLAKALSKNFKVLVIEAGGGREEQLAKDSLEGSVSGIDYPLVDTRARIFGGSSTIWAGYCAQFDLEDFQFCPWIPESGWPIEAEDVLRYYAKASELLHVDDGCFEPNKLKKELFNLSETTFSDTFKVGTWRFGKTKANFASENIAYLENSTSIDLLLNACVTNIYLDESNTNSIEHIEIRSSLGRVGKVKANKYILATGGIETPRLLLSSRNQNLEGVANKSGKVGKYFMEHPHVTICGIDIKNDATLNEWTDVVTAVDGKKFTRCLGFSPAYKAQNRVLNARVHFYRTPQMSTTEKPKAGLFFEQAPNCYSCLTLTDKIDSFGMPRVNLNWELSELDRYSHEVICKDVARELIFRGIAVQTGRLGASEELLYSNHQLGTTRMSKSSRDGVVDENCKAHDIENLFIVGGSVFPTVSWANPTLTVLALTLRLADHINGEDNDFIP